MYPSPLNPLAVDFKYFEGLPLVERVIATGAMAHFLQKVVASGDHAYNARGTEKCQVRKDKIAVADLWPQVSCLSRTCTLFSRNVTSTRFCDVRDLKKKNAKFNTRKIKDTQRLKLQHQIPI